MGKPRDRESSPQAQDAEGGERVRAQEILAPGDVHARDLGVRRLQLVVCPPYSESRAWEVRQLPDDWRLYRSRLPPAGRRGLAGGEAPGLRPRAHRPARPVRVLQTGREAVAADRAGPERWDGPGRHVDATDPVRRLVFGVAISMVVPISPEMEAS